MIEVTKRVRRLISPLWLAPLLAWGALGWSGFRVHPLALLVLTAALLWSWAKASVFFASQEPDKRRVMIVCAVFSLALCCCLVLQGRVVFTGSIGAVYPENTMLPFTGGNLLFLLFGAPAAFVLAVGCSQWLREGEGRLSAWMHSGSPCARRVLVVSFALLMVCWGVYWLTFFPGTANSDNTRMLTWTMARAANQHPWFYHGLLSLVVRGVRRLTGSVNAGVAAYSFLQMACSALAVSWTASWMAGRRCPRPVLALYLAYFACSPMMANIAVLGTKDVPFAIVFLLLFPLLAELWESGGALWNYRRAALLSGVLAALGLLRSNGLLVAAAVGLMCLVFLKRHRGWSVVVLAAGVAAPALFSAFMVNTILGVEPIFTEKIGIPLQQVAMTVVEEGTLTEEQEAFLYQVFPREYYFEKYAPMNVDSIKWGSHPDTGPGRDYLQTHQGEFLRTWAGMLPRNAGAYARAWLLQTYGFWSVGTGGAQVQGYYWDYSGAGDTDLGIRRIQVWPDGLQGVLENFYKRTMTGVGSGTMMWLVFLLCLVVLTSRRPGRVFVLAPAILLWGTLMVSVPIAFGYRYAFPLFVSLPIAAYLVASSNHARQS